MAETETKLTREDIAKIEIGHTDVSRPVAWALILAVLATVFTIPAVQHVADIQSGLRGKRPTPVPQAYDIFTRLDDPFHVAARSQRKFPWNIVRGNSVLLREINRFEDELEDSSLLQQWLLPPAQAALVRYGGAGNEQAYLGRGDWLFYRPGVDHLTGPGFLDAGYLAARRAGGNEWQPAPQPDPIEAILQFRQQLAERDIELIVVPTPIKPSIHPEKLSRRYENRGKPVRNPSFSRFVKTLRSAGVMVFDPAEVLIAAKRDPNGSTAPQYLRTDTHWRPAAMERVAAALAAFLAERDLLAIPRNRSYTRGQETVSNVGDIARMLKLPEDQTLFEPETVTIHPVLQGNAAWASDPSADVLVLGDSFSNIYTFDGMGWGFAAGFVEQLAYHLQRPLDRIARNDDGAHATRKILSTELAAGRDRLAGKRLVIWQFAARELSVGDWKLLPMELGEPKRTNFLQPTPDAEGRTVTGTITRITRPASPPQVYDEAITLYLDDLKDAEGQPIQGKRLKVMTWGLLDNRWTPAARLPAGREVTLHIKPMSADPQMSKARRKDVDDFELEVEEPWLADLAGEQATTQQAAPEGVNWTVVTLVALTFAGMMGLVCVQIVRGDRAALRQTGAGTPTTSDDKTKEPTQ